MENGQHLQSSCESYARDQKRKCESLATKILKAGGDLSTHEDFAEFMAINNYLHSVGN